VQNKPSKETLEKWHKDPNNWIWGIFYYNKEDKRLLPPKRIAMMGWTINLANPSSIGILLLIILIILACNYLLLR
jgi:uncharacterized membrane protein